MAQAKKEEVTAAPAPQPKASSGTKYYRCRNYSALKIWGKDEPLAQFTPYLEVFRGDTVRVGYLVTDDKKVQGILENDISVVELTEKEYKGYMKDAKTAPLYS